MKQQSKYELIYSFAIALTAFVQTLAPKMVPISIVILAFVVIFGVLKKRLKWKPSIVPILFVALYLAYIIGMFFTMDGALARIYLENKVSFFLFPVLFSFVPTFPFSWRIPTIGFMLGLSITLIYGFVKIGSCFWLGGNFATCIIAFSEIHHPTYLSAFILFGMALSIYGYQQKWKFFNGYLVSIFCLFALISIFLSFSLSGIIFAFLTFSLVIWFWIKKRQGIRKTVLLTSVVMVATVFSVMMSPIKEDLKYSAISISSYFESPENFLKKANRYLIGNEVRLIMWTSTGLLIAEHPFGVGTGNVDFYLAKKLKSYGLDELATHEYNPHNQFLQTFLEIGIFGFLILAGIVFFAIRHALKTKNYLLLLLILSLFFNSLFESMLQRQSGIIFYTFWICLLTTAYFSNPEMSKLNDANNS